MRRKYRAVLNVLDKIEIGICLLDGAGRLILINSHAANIFSEKDAIWRTPAGTLATNNAEKTAEIAAAVRSMIATSQGEGREASVEISIPKWDSKPHVLVIASPLRDSGMELDSNTFG